ncbi:Y-family DNA polymerase [Shimia thalassica]|uniref:Y-family DNA polymerase n=1 Tax=Shimia thalassica TaxID=1715693 RepID=UPI0024950D7F|nr:DNA polymerase Y family protein [Shimia thalassica]
MQRRIVSLWFPRLSSDRVLRGRSVDGPFALTIHQSNTERLYCLNVEAEAQGLSRGMGFSDARAYCPDLQTRPADLQGDQRFLAALLRWAGKYSPWVGYEGNEGLVLDVTGASHLFGGEAGMLGDMRLRLMRAGVDVRIGLADTRGAAWGLARFGEGVAAKGDTGIALAGLPVAALRLEEKICTGLERLGVRTVQEFRGLPRATVTRRFGNDVLLRLDQALGDRPEGVTPEAEVAPLAVRLTFPEPIGLSGDVLAGTERLLSQLCLRLKAEELGVRRLELTLRRVDQASQQVELRLARPLRDVESILPLFERGLSEVDAGFGIDQMRLEAVQAERLPVRQLSHVEARSKDGVSDLITRLGSRIGLDNIHRMVPADSHIPERSFSIAAAAYSPAAGRWPVARPRPVVLFPPEGVAAEGRHPPKHFQWRRMRLTAAQVSGPERIAPEWWLPDDNWRSGVRDYWRVETRQGRRLWMYHTPQAPGWYVQGEFA